MHRLLLLLSGFLFSALVSASALTDQLQRLVDEGKMQQAWQLALPQLDNQAGDPEFDLPYGIAAIENGQINEGVFALERVIFLQPDNHRARLEYGRGLFILGQDALARQAFNRVLERASPPPAVVSKIEQFLAAIRRRESRYQTTANGYVAFGWGYDSNINSAPANQLTLIQLNQQSLGKGDQFSTLRAGGQLYVPQSKSRKFYGRWDSSLRRYRDDREQDNDNHSLTLGHQWSLQKDLLDFSVNVQQYLLDDSRYRKLYGPTLNWTRALGGDLRVQSGASWLLLDHPDLDWRNSRQLLLSSRLFGNLDMPMSPSWFAGVFVGDERSDDQTTVSKASVDRVFIGAQAGGQLTLAPKWGLIATTTVQGSNYEGDDFLYGVARDDTYYALDLELKHLLDAHWQAGLNLNYSKNASNIELYEYRRRQLSLSIRYEF